MSDRVEKVQEVLRHLGAAYLSAESDRTSLITVTHTKISRDLKKATIFVSVYPENRERVAIDFLKRKRSDFRNYVKENAHMKRIPTLDFEIDEGEKNRQRIDTLLNE
jgi:ribosome-binding factor A|tara:strand:+ start:14400 stop:14720 length:321 start_codon:yes stop_codon:yes gene_type:complete